jgi:hypothetical protein
VRRRLKPTPGCNAKEEEEEEEEEEYNIYNFTRYNIL